MNLSLENNMPSLIRCASALAGLVIFILMISRVIYFYLSPDDILISILPDDSFYYIQLARHRVSDGFWTFDGTATATGFHLLYGYFLVFIYTIFGDIDWHTLFLLIGFLSSIAISLSAYFVSRAVEAAFDSRVIPIAIAPFLTSAAIIQSTSMMESWMVVFFASLTIYKHAKDEDATALSNAGLLAIGILGSLSRSDYGMLPGILFITALITSSNKKFALNNSFFILSGAIIGVAISLLHNYYISGYLTQASAQTKLYWSSLLGHSIFVPIDLFKSVALPAFPSSVAHLVAPSIVTLIKLGAAAILIRLIFVTWQARHTRFSNLPRSTLSIVFGSALTVACYIVFYKFNSASLQNWYAANFLVPVSFVLAALVFFLFKGRWAFIVSIVGLTCYAISIPTHIFSTLYPHQAGMLQAGAFLKSQDNIHTYGSWNAGIISYFSGKNVINLDGLTNDDVLPYIKSNHLLDYIKYRRIDRLVDYEEMISSHPPRLRGGYSEARIDRCIVALHSIDGSAPKWCNTRLKIFIVKDACL